jgi:hypothetical protein
MALINMNPTVAIIPKMISMGILRSGCHVGKIVIQSAAFAVHKEFSTGTKKGRHKLFFGQTRRKCKNYKSDDWRCRIDSPAIYGWSHRQYSDPICVGSPIELPPGAFPLPEPSPASPLNTPAAAPT